MTPIFTKDIKDKPRNHFSFAKISILTSKNNPFHSKFLSHPLKFQNSNYLIDRNHFFFGWLEHLERAH